MADADAQAEKEQRDLSKKMRLLEGNRKQYAGDTKSAIQKQHDTISALKKENKKLKEEMKLAEGSTGYNMKFQTQIQAKEEAYETVQRRLDLETRKQRELDQQIAELKASLMERRKKRAETMGGVNATQENHQMVEKQIKVLENRLDQALVKFNEALSKNKALREEIDNLRGERVVFDGIYKKLEKELHEKKKEMAEIIEKSNLYYEDRDASGVELKHLREAAEKDIQQYDKHFEELDLMMEANKTLENSIKHLRSQSRAPQNKAEEEDDMGRSKKKVEKKQTDIETEQETRVTNYQEIVDQLKEATGIQDMEVLHQKFVKAEEQNFSMYNFVNELNTEIEQLEEDIEKLKEFTTAEKGDPTRMKQLKELEDELSKAEGLAESLNDSTIQAKKRIEDLQAIITDIFNKLGCSTDEIMESLGTAECTESNMMLFLGMVEQRVNELLAAYNVAKASEFRTKARIRDEEKKQAKERRVQERQARREQGDEIGEEDEEDEEAEESALYDPQQMTGRPKFIGVGPTVPMGGTNLAKVVESKLPAAGDSFGNEYNDDGEDDQKIFTQEELRAQTEARLARHQNKDDRADRGKKKGKDKHRRN
eukprot:Sspe_Gene.4555::Locus_1493_Transcript_1_1_Confidence_1.000_Length_1879::g.4555::m.4555